MASKANVNAAHKDGFTPLYVASENGHVEVVKLLLANKADVNDDAEERWVQEVINHRGKTTRSEECTPGYYNMEGDNQRRQDGNYNGSYPEYIAHTKNVVANIETNFTFHKR